MKRETPAFLRMKDKPNEDERHQLELILKTKKWNPYCIRHSVNSTQGWYKRRMGRTERDPV
ncbi:MAG: hypothetical protein WBZ36_10435 [Candidatus Nitrosopolaris sp.]